EANELVPLANERGDLFWGSLGMIVLGCVLALTGKVSDAVHVITSGIIARRSTAATALEPFCLSYLAGAHAELDNFDDALHCIREAMTKAETTRKVGLRPKSSAWQAKSRYCCPTQTQRKRKNISNMRWRSLVGSRQSPGNCVRL